MVNDRFTRGCIRYLHGAIKLYHILISNDVASEIRTSEMIVAQKVGQSSGASYQWLDAGARLGSGNVYVLEFVKADGRIERTVIGATESGENQQLFLPFAIQ